MIKCPKCKKFKDVTIIVDNINSNPPVLKCHCGACKYMFIIKQIPKKYQPRAVSSTAEHLGNKKAGGAAPSPSIIQRIKKLLF